MAGVNFSKGLEGVIAAESAICRIDGVEGRLYYRGYSIEDLAARSTFEEVTYLLLYDALPKADGLAAFSRRMRRSRDIPPPIRDMIRSFPPRAHPMELLQSVIAYLGGYIEHVIEHSPMCNCRDTLHQVSQLASVVATYWRFRQGLDYVPPREDLSHGANFLHMLHGEEPDPEDGAIMDACLTLHAEHGFNASTFTARVVASTLSTCYCSISSAIGSLYGSLHGGANERVMAMLEEIGDSSRAESYIDGALAHAEKVMGMGHRVYKATDPRAIIIERSLERLVERKGERRIYDILKECERVMAERMRAAGKPVYPNVDFYSGAVYHLLGIPRSLFTPIFAMARVSGWLAHILEQRADNRLYRPRSLYSGPEPRPYVPIEKR